MNKKWRKKISLANKGKHFFTHTKESKRKMKKNHKNYNGKNNPFYNKKHTEKTKQKIAIANMSLDRSLGSISSLYAQYKHSAKIKKIPFSLSKRYFKKLTSDKCFYCGVSPFQIIRYKQGFYIYNGIDRINNKKGYTRDNCVSCCGQCNRMKLTYSVEDFLSHTERIYNCQRKKNDSITY